MFSLYFYIVLKIFQNITIVGDVGSDIGEAQGKRTYKLYEVIVNCGGTSLTSFHDFCCMSLGFQRPCCDFISFF